MFMIAGGETEKRSSEDVHVSVSKVEEEATVSIQTALAIAEGHGGNFSGMC